MRRMASFEDLKKIAEEVLEEHGGGGGLTIEKTIIENGTYDATTEEPIEGKNVVGYSKVEVDVQPELGTKTITEAGTYNAADDNVYGYGTVNVEMAPYLPKGTLFSRTHIKRSDTSLEPFTFRMAPYFRPEDREFTTLHYAFSNFSVTNYNNADVPLKIDISGMTFADGISAAYMFENVHNLLPTENDIFKLDLSSVELGAIDHVLSGTTYDSQIKKVILKARSKADFASLTSIVRSGSSTNPVEYIEVDLDNTNQRSTNNSALGSQGIYNFSNCRTVKFGQNLKNVTMSANAIGNLSSVTAIVIQNSEKIYSLTAAATSCFAGCYHILGTVNATYNPQGLQDCYIYVPDALVDQYKAATNWSAIASQIRPLSEYTGE